MIISYVKFVFPIYPCFLLLLSKQICTAGGKKTKETKIYLHTYCFVKMKEYFSEKGSFFA